MSGEHTPGPWVASDHHAGVGWRVESDAGGYPNDGWVVVSAMEGPDAEANARACAAVPDLLLALEWYAEQVAACRKVTSEGETARRALDQDGGTRARAAIARTKGDVA